MLHQFKALAGGVWLDSEPITILGMPLSSNMTVMRLGDGALLLHSPVAMTPARRAAVDALGPVAHLYAPNTFHHLALGDWAAAYPSARIHAPAGLVRKRRDLCIDRTHGSPLDSALASDLEEIAIDGFRLEESALYLRSASTLIVADLVQNVGRPSHPWARLYTRAMGFYDRAALSRVIRWTGFSDRAAARRCIDRLLALSFDRLVVGHGLPVVERAREILGQAYAWLPAAPEAAA